MVSPLYDIIIQYNLMYLKLSDMTGYRGVFKKQDHFTPDYCYLYD